MQFLMSPMASHGYVFPAMGIAHELARRGHQVCFATGMNFREIIESAGFTRIPRAEGSDGPSFDVRVWAHPGETMRQIAHLEYAIEVLKPDVLVGSELNIGVLIAARYHGIPAAQIGLATYLWPTWDESQQPQNNHESFVEHRYHGVIKDLYTRVCDALGLSYQSYRDSPRDYRNPLLVGDLALLRTVPELAHYSGSLPARVEMVGACLWEPPATPDDELQRWIERMRDANRPLIYVQHGTHPGASDFWPNLVAAIADLPIAVIAAGPKLIDQVESLPENYLVRDFVSRHHVMPYVDAVVNQGTSSVMLAALTAGVPLLLLPVGSEHPYVAEQCERAGVAYTLPAYDNYHSRSLDENITPERLHDGLMKVLEDSSLRVNARSLQQAFERAGGFSHAADLLESLG